MTKYETGPWSPVKDGNLRNWMLLRDLIGSGGKCELMTEADGSLRLFSTEAQAREAIERIEADERFLKEGA
jgi:hypothetical protein